MTKTAMSSVKTRLLAIFDEESCWSVMFMLISSAQEIIDSTVLVPTVSLLSRHLENRLRSRYYLEPDVPYMISHATAINGTIKYSWCKKPPIRLLEDSSSMKDLSRETTLLAGFGQEMLCARHGSSRFAHAQLYMVMFKVVSVSVSQYLSVLSRR